MNKILLVISYPLVFVLSLYFIYKYHDELLEVMREQAYQNAIRYFANEIQNRHGVEHES